MDPALKKRMIGAAILIVLAVVFVPMLFTGRPNERTETVDLNLPKAPDRDFTTRTIPLRTAPKPAPQASDALPTVDTAKEREKGGTTPTPAPAQTAKAEPPVPTPNPKAQPPVTTTTEPAAADKPAETSAG